MAIAETGEKWSLRHHMPPLTSIPKASEEKLNASAADVTNNSDY